MPASERPSSVYLMRDGEGALLYVGVTTRSHMRQAEHMAMRKWAASVATTHWEHYSSRDKALRREAELLRTERPRYNVAGTGARRHIDPETRQELTETLAALGTLRSRLRRELKDTMAEIAETTREAFAAGLMKTEIAKLAQISRPALDELLRRR